MSLFLQFAELNDALAATTKKLEKRAFLADYLRSLPVADSDPERGAPGGDAGRAALWLAGTPFPETDPRVLQTGGSLLSKAIAQLSGASPAALGAAYRRYGDFGSAAADLLYGHAPTTATLTLADVESAFAALAQARGPAAKLRVVLDLLGRATPLEAKYLIKLITGDMRTGVQQSLVEEAIAEAWSPPSGSLTSTKTPPTAGSASAGQVVVRWPAASVRRASMLLGSLPEVVALAAAQRLDEARMRLFHPLGFMLASPVQSIDEALTRVTEETEAEAGSTTAWQLEDKFDGIRAQLHVDGTGRVALYSRNRDDLSPSFPDLVEAFAALGEAAILDGEILAWNPAESRALPFAALQPRLGRKRVSPEMQRTLPAVLVVFDTLYQGDQLLLTEPLTTRRRQLEDFCARWASSTAATNSRGQANLFEALAGQARAEGSFPRLILASATRLDPGSAAAQLEQAYQDARARGNEGVMLKSLASAYQPGRRGLAWLKLKRELATLDVVVTGAEYGNGRRAAVLSDVTFAVRDPEDPEQPLKNIGKAYSGLTDQEIASLTAFFLAHTLEDHGHFRTVEPSVVLEVAFNNVMRSTRHASGFALRFPRIVRIRTDKPVAEIDSLARVEEIYAAQPDKPVES